VRKKENGMSVQLKFVLAQLDPCVGDLKANTQKAIQTVSENRSADVIVFSECFLSGYPLDDLVLRPKFLAAVEEQLAEVTKAVVEIGGPAVILGFPEEGSDLPFNAAVFIGPEGSKRVIRKVDRPNDGVFDEVRYFAKGQLRPPIMFRGVRIGIGICEEMWHPEVSRHLAGHLADILIFINGSPYSRGKHEGDRMAHAKARVRETGLPLIYVNQVGAQDELVFDGASFALDGNGEVVLQMPAFQTSTTYLRFPFRKNEHLVKAYPGTNEADYLACVLGLRGYVQKSGFEKVVIGMSGGIDSALAGTMAVDALGYDRVHAITLPSRVTSKDNIGDAAKVCQNLGIRMDTVEIGDTVEAAQRMLGIFGNDSTVTDENIQARARMIALMGWSNMTGDMVLTTGNKSENAVGYATLYGDMAGGFNPLKDLYKTEVWELSKYRNTVVLGGLYGPEKPIPANVIAKPPSAELAVGQTDEATLGPYPILDAILRGIIDHDLDAAAALNLAMKTSVGMMIDDPKAAPFLTLEHAQFIGRLVNRAEYKRRQSAPGVKIGPRAFGRDRRYPIINRFAF
jgi:NAD+ synthase